MDPSYLTGPSKLGAGSPFEQTPLEQNPLARASNAEQRAQPLSKEDARLMAVARKLEASFLSEMLKSAGVGETPEVFGGGAGEDQFASFLREAQADEMVKAGGIGLAQSFYEALKE